MRAAVPTAGRECQLASIPSPAPRPRPLLQHAGSHGAGAEGRGWEGIPGQPCHTRHQLPLLSGATCPSPDSHALIFCSWPGPLAEGILPPWPLQGQAKGWAPSLPILRVTRTVTEALGQGHSQVPSEVTVSVGVRTWGKVGHWASSGHGAPAWPGRRWTGAFSLSPCSWSCVQSC